MSETITAAQLRAAADLIAAPGGWWPYSGAGTADGHPCEPTAQAAARWDTHGVLQYVTGLPHASAVVDALGMRVSYRLSAGAERGGQAGAVAELRRLADLADAREAVAR